MDKMMYCPMMMGQMPMMYPQTAGMMDNDPDEDDDNYFMSMAPEVSGKMMPYVNKSVDRMEEKQDIYSNYPDREMIKSMSDHAYNSMIRDMPDMADEDENRQFGRRRFGRDLVGVLLLNELFRRRRRRRRPHYGGYGGYSGNGGYGDYDDFYDGY